MLGAMQLQAADDVWARIASVSGSRPGGLVATDGDGTLWTGDVGEEMFHAFVDAADAAPSATEALRGLARAHGVPDAGAGHEVARRLYEAYVAGRFPEEPICELMAWCFAGWTRDRVRAFARDVVERCGLSARLHREVIHELDRARSAGIEVVLVSASPVAVVLEAGGRVGFDEAHVVAARPCFEGDVMLPDVERPIPYGPGKVSCLRERIGDRALYAALGDNAFDVALLAGAAVPVAVRPKPRLRERAHEVAAIVELAPEGKG